jgi:hypothetical protein
VTNYWLHYRGLILGRCKTFSSSAASKPVRPALGPTPPPIQWLPVTLFTGIKRPGQQADHSSTSSVKVKKDWSYTSTAPHVFRGVVLKSTIDKFRLHFLQMLVLQMPSFQQQNQNSIHAID